ncbi:MAG: P-loop NTPase [bacterium]
MDEYYVKVNDRQYGPLALKELKDFAEQGNFTPEDLVWQAEINDWVSAEQVHELRDLFITEIAKEEELQNKLYAIASGKGGVGKTVLTVSLGVGLAKVGNQVIMVDADLGGADLHICMGVLEPKYTYFDFYTLQRESLSDIVLETCVDNLQMISGACGTLGLANPKYFQKLRFIRELKKLQADFILVDLGAGSSLSVIDFFLLADEPILVMAPEPTSVHEVFGFIKICLMRKLNRAFKYHPKILETLAKEEVNRPGRIQLTANELLKQIVQIEGDAADIFNTVVESFQPKLILNMVREQEDLKEAQALQSAAKELLSLQVEYLGHVSYDPTVAEAVNKTKPFLLHDPDSQASQDLTELIKAKFLW